MFHPMEVEAAPLFTRENGKKIIIWLVTEKRADILFSKQKNKHLALNIFLKLNMLKNVYELNYINMEREKWLK